MDANLNDRIPLATPGLADLSQAALPPLPKRHFDIPWPDMPERMLVTIDGWHDTPKALVGEWVAYSLGGLLVNSDQIYRSLVAACSKSVTDINDYGRVESWCEQAAVEIGFAKDHSRALEAQVAVNNQWFSKCDLEKVTELVSNRAAYDTFWDKVRQVLRRCEFDDRVVIVGSDAGYEFPKTPYRFFLDNTSGNRNPTELAGLAYSWSGRVEKYYGSGGVTHFQRSISTLMIDANRAAAPEIVCVVLVESVMRAREMGFVAGRLDAILGDAYFLADATRKRMRAVIAEHEK